MAKVKRVPRRLREASDALFGAPLYLAPGNALEQMRAAALRIGDDPIRSQSVLAERNRARLRPRAEGAPQPRGYSFMFYGPSTERRDDGIAVIKVVGSLYRGLFWDDYADLRARVDEALDDSAVRAVLLDVDSPGGRVAGLFDLTRHLFSLRDHAKPIWAIADDSATSAAYAIASATRRVITTPTAVTGSIGALVLHYDQSKWNRELGFTVTEVASGERKTDLSPNKPLSARGRATLEALVTEAADQFFSEVARYRPALTVDAVRAQEAAIFVGAAARDAGLVDAVANLDEVLDELRAELSKPTRPGGSLALSAPTPTAASPAGETPMSLNTQPQTPAAAAAAPAAAAQPAAAAAPAAAPAPAPAPAPAAAAAAPAAPAPAPAPAPAADPFLERARLITNACALAGQPHLAGDMIANGLSLAAAQDRLLELRANRDPAVISSHQPNATGAQASPRPIDTEAVYRRWNDPEALGKPAPGARTH